MRLASKDAVLTWYHCREVPSIRCTARVPASHAAAGHSSLPLQDARAPDDGHVLRFSDTCRVAIDARGAPACASGVHRHTHISSAVWHIRPQLGCCRLCHSEVFRSNHVLLICFHVGGTSAATFGMNFVVKIRFFFVADCAASIFRLATKHT